MEEVEVEVADAEVLERVGNSEGNVLGVVVELEELGGDPELLAGNTGGLDALADLGLVACKESVQAPMSRWNGTEGTLLEATASRQVPASWRHVSMFLLQNSP